MLSFSPRVLLHQYHVLHHRRHPTIGDEGMVLGSWTAAQHGEPVFLCSPWCLGGSLPSIGTEHEDCRGQFVCLKYSVKGEYSVEVMRRGVLVEEKVEGTKRFALGQ